MRTRKTMLKAKAPSGALPDGVLASDMKYPDWKKKSEQTDSSLGDYGSLTFYETSAFGWCMATLHIARGRRGNGNRTYATRVSDGATVRVGNGPHVLRTIQVYVKKNRRSALKKYTDMYAAGAQEANEIRDRISSRRVQGALMRAQGRTSWMWDR